MEKLKTKIAANSNENVAENYKMAVGDGFIQANCSKLETSKTVGSALETMLTRAQNFQTQKANNDNFDGGDDTPPPSSEAKVPETADIDDTSYVVIDVDEVAKRTHIPKQELELICSGNNTMVAIPTGILELNQFITVQEGASKTAGALAKKKILPPETRKYFLKKAQEYGYLWLKGEVQLGNEIRKIRGKQGDRTDLQAANDNKKKDASLDDVLNELRTKKEILAEDYSIGYTQARQLARLTDDLVVEELKYAVANNDTLSRTHALSFLSRPPELTDEEKEDADTEKAQKKTKAKFNFTTTFSDVPFSKRKGRVLKKPIFYTSIAACVGSDEYYLEDHGLVCKVALECDKNRAKYFVDMHKMRSKHEVNMIVGKLEEKYDELVEAFKNSNSELLKCTIPCQTFCAMRSKDWRDDPRLLLVLYCVKLIKETKPKYILFENAREFFGFSLPLHENLDAHPIAKELQTALNGRTMGDYLRDELTAPGFEYDLNFAIEDACYYGTAQSRVRSILLGSKDGTWNFPKAEKFAMPLWEAIGHLPSLEAGEDSGILYHKAPLMHNDPEVNAKMANALAHTGTGRKSQDNDPKYQLSGFGFYGAKGARKFWDRPSNTLDGGSKNATGNRTIHPARLRKDGTYSDARVLTLLEVFLTNGLENYVVPAEFENDTSFIYGVMGEIFLPRMLERIILELPTSWEETETEE